jgi:uncharacterized membrane protein
MTVGPLQLIVIRYEGDRVDDAIGRELSTLEQERAVRVVDLALVGRSADAPPRVRRVRDFTDAELEPFRGATGDLMGLLRPTLLEDVAADLPPGTTALVALVDHTWTTGLRDAVRRSGGELVTDAFLAPETVDALNAELHELEVVAE